jgi:hypothetical protein
MKRKHILLIIGIVAWLSLGAVLKVVWREPNQNLEESGCLFKYVCEYAAGCQDFEIIFPAMQDEHGLIILPEDRLCPKCCQPVTWYVGKREPAEVQLLRFPSEEGE